MNSKPTAWYLVLISAAAGALLTSEGFHALWPDWRWHHEPLHSTMETLSGLASLAMALVLLLRCRAPADRKFQALAAGLLGMGLLALFHAAAQPGNGFVLLRNMASLAGGVGFGLVWLPDPEKSRPERTWLPWTVMIGALGFGVWTVTFPEQIPEMVRNGEFTPTAVAPQSLAAMGFLAATLRFLLDHRTSGKPEDYLFASLAFIFGLAELVFMYSVLWDSRWWFWHGLRLLACFLVLGYVSRGYFRMVSELERSLVQTTIAEQTVRRSEQQLRHMFDERERIAQNLHDGSIQTLYAISLGLERCQRLIGANSQELTTHLKTAVADLKLVIQDLRGYLVGIEPPISTGRELEAALAALIANMERSDELRFHLQVAPAAADLVTSAQAPQLLSIAREAMSNSLRHSGARTGTIALRLEDGAVRLVVEDDGVGFVTASAGRQGHGLRNMAARTRKLGGRLEVLSSPGHGTRIVFDLPKEPLHAPA